ncbi:Adaptor complexes medium subunit family protein [Cryptosporidium meleagridis]|uniref:Adaptor complexes medium subunit family protein n=1 Tax=Cryptosporidium meleagridis TaxID=93969 RepID=A0A2P4YY67_9CRYT|nr:Adaptor complexes medium subunit family protein [Cryptosporidium meleagridis]
MCGVSAIFILDLNGKPIIGRNYKGDISESGVLDAFQQHVIEQEESCIKPIFSSKLITYCWIKYNNLYLVLLSRKNSNAIMMITFLYKLIEILKDYFKVLEEESIRDNFVVIYELLDEIMDNGFPQITEVKVLREYIKNEAHELSAASVLVQSRSSSSSIKPPTALSNVISWRPEGIKHKKNEIFLDVIEKVNMIIGSSGDVINSEIVGTLTMKSYLSGMPELKLGLNDRLGDASISTNNANRNSASSSNRNSILKNKSVEIEDIKFHQCVRLARFESDRTISFIPPDGQFELMSYRLTPSSNLKPLFKVDVNIENISTTRIKYVIKVKGQYKARSVAKNTEIQIPVPSDVIIPTFKTSIGTVKYSPERDLIVWNIKTFSGQKEFTMTAIFDIPSIINETSTSKRPVTVGFEIPYFTISGLTIRYLKITEKSGYQALPWVRYITQNGNYEIRMP